LGVDFDLDLGVDFDLDLGVDFDPLLAWFLASRGIRDRSSSGRLAVHGSWTSPGAVRQVTTPLTSVITLACSALQGDRELNTCIYRENDLFLTILRQNSDLADSYPVSRVSFILYRSTCGCI